MTPMQTENPDCKHGAGQFVPVVNRNRCEGKADCVRVCPYEVFTVGVLPLRERQGLSLIGKIRAMPTNGSRRLRPARRRAMPAAFA